MPKMFTWTAHNGDTFRGATGFGKAMISKMMRAGYVERSHCRIGHHAVIVAWYGGAASLVITRMYQRATLTAAERGAHVPSEDPAIEASYERVVAAVRRDRLALLHKVLSLIAGHPLEADVRADVAFELAGLAIELNSDNAKLRAR